MFPTRMPESSWTTNWRNKSLDSGSNHLIGVFVVEIRELAKKRALADAENVQDRVREIVTKTDSAH